MLSTAITQIHNMLHQACPLFTILSVIFMANISKHCQGEEGVGLRSLRIASMLFVDDVLLALWRDAVPKEGVQVS